MEYVAIVVLLSLLQYCRYAFIVAGMRARLGAPATEIAKSETLKRAIRVHANTGEMLIVFLPLIVLCGYFLNGPVAAGIGVLWLLARFLYRSGYMKSVKERIPGFFMGNIVLLLLAIGAVYGIGRSLFGGVVLY